MSDALDLDAIQARADAATEGPWSKGHTEVSKDSDLIYDDPRWPGEAMLPREGPQEVADCYRGDNDEREANAEFIAHARTDVPALVAEVKALRATVAAQDATLQRVKALADEWDRAADAIQNPSGGHLRIEKPSDLVQAATIRLRAALASEATDTDTDEQPTKETQ